DLVRQHLDSDNRQECDYGTKKDDGDSRPNDPGSKTVHGVTPMPTDLRRRFLDRSRGHASKRSLSRRWPALAPERTTSMCRGMSVEWLDAPAALSAPRD